MDSASYLGFEAVRKQEQKKFSKSHRRYFKKSRQLLIKRFDSLSDEQKQQVNIMIYASPTLSTVHFYKEDFSKFLILKTEILLKLLCLIGLTVLWIVEYLSFRNVQKL